MDNKLKMPTKRGWYWIITKGTDWEGKETPPIPCWFMPGNGSSDYQSDGGCFLPAGLGDSSRDGIYADDIERIGPEIPSPEF